MPGVPSGRGCEACRKQKKKCELTLPSCKRCTRLGLECIGAGQKRFKFVEGHAAAARSSTKSSTLSDILSQRSSPDSDIHGLFRMPSNESTLLTIALVEKFHITYDLRYHLSWTYGDFLEAIPPRLGTNEALDTATASLLAAHAHLGSSQRHLTSIHTLSKYTTALTTLRRTLNDPVLAAQPETLCAIYLLLISQSFIDACAGLQTSHVQGAVQVLKARGKRDSESDFEKKVLISLRGPILMQALLDPKIQFEYDEWIDLMMKYQGVKGHEGAIMRGWAEMPWLMDRGRVALKTGDEAQRLVLAEQALRDYGRICAALSYFKEKYLEFQGEKPIPGQTSDSRKRKHNALQRLYGLALIITLISNCIAQALEPGDAELLEEGKALCDDTFILAEEAAMYRPLASSFIILACYAAWVAVRDQKTRDLVREKMVEYMSDWPVGMKGDLLDDSLANCERRLRLLA